jgi:hypothetical protein
MKQNIGFHGEITYTPQTELPDGETKTVKSLIVGHSETGHHHVLECDTAFEQIMTDNGIYVRLEQEARLFHKKDHDIHETRTLSPGVYRFGEKTEYNPWTKAIQRVFD